MEREGVKLDTEKLAAISEQLAGQAESAPGGDLGARRARVHDRLAAAARRGPLRGPRPEPQAPRQDRLLDRRPRPLADPRRARDRPEDRALARGHEADQHLPRLAAGADRSRGRPHPHDLQPGPGRDRAPLEHEPEPPEHPDPLRPRPSDPRLLRRRGGRSARLLRLQPGRAAGPRPRLRRRGPAGDLRLRRGRPLGDRRGHHRRRSRRDHARRALEGEDGQLRDRLRALRIRARRAPLDPAGGGGDLHRPLLRALRGRQAVHRRDDRGGAARRAACGR